MEQGQNNQNISESSQSHKGNERQGPQFTEAINVKRNQRNNCIKHIKTTNFKVEHDQQVIIKRLGANWQQQIAKVSGSTDEQRSSA